MTSKFVCRNCGRQANANPRLKGGQHYCKSRECQRARKRSWQKNKLANDPDYRRRQKECQRSWCKRKPLHHYQSEYRKRHAEYVEANRLKQRERNRRNDMAEDMQKIVKMDTFFSASRKTGTYLLNWLGGEGPEKIVKMDTLIVQLTPLHDMSLPG